jgi:SagB-type dehydrogenase family enzyme
MRGELELAWRVIELMDGRRRVGEIVEAFPSEQRRTVAALIATLNRLGAVDVSGRAIRNFLHATTQYLALPTRELDEDSRAALRADGEYRRYEDAPRIAPEPDSFVAPRLDELRRITRARRSPLELVSETWPAAMLFAILDVACGVTGEFPGRYGATPLRAHPSGGALYSVEVYPLVLRVEGVDAGVYHYDPLAHELEVLRTPRNFAATLAESCTQAGLVAGCSVVFALTGHYRRYERKYGSNGFRTLVSEAGHISQNLILAVTAAGGAARPLGAWFEPALNELLGLATDAERYLASVVAGQPPPTDARADDPSGREPAN